MMKVILLQQKAKMILNAIRLFVLFLSVRGKPLFAAQEGGTAQLRRRAEKCLERLCGFPVPSAGCAECTLE